MQKLVEEYKTKKQDTTNSDNCVKHIKTDILNLNKKKEETTFARIKLI